MARITTLALCTALVLIPSLATAMPPSDTLLPNTTKGYLSVPDVDQLRERWQRTQLGQMAADPMMKPFIEDLRAQLENKLSSARLRLGLSLADLKDIYGGELCLAMLEPEQEHKQHASLVLVDVTGHLEQVAAMLEKVGRNLLNQGATRRTEQLGSVTVQVFTMPKRREDSPTVEAIYAVHRDVLLVCDDATICHQILERLDGAAGASLADVPAYAATMDRCAAASGQLEPHVKWFVEPFGYGRALRAATGGRRKKGPDLLRVLPNQGFGAIRGMGGHVFVSTGDEDLVHRTMVYAPPVETASGEPSPEKYTLAARMLHFPNTDGLLPQDFVTRELGSYFTFNWKMREAFEYSKTLVNELLGGGKEDDLMEDIIVGLAEDKDGPQVDLREDLVAHFAERVSLWSDCRRPVTPESERLMVAIELTEPEAVRATIDKAFNADPDALKREFQGHVIWEIIKDRAPAEVEELQIEGPGVFDPFGVGSVPEVEEEDEPEEAQILPNSAITVAHGHLVVATHVDFIVEMLERPLATNLLADAADYQLVADALEKLGAGPLSFRFFARTDETYRATYELLRQGKMPESKTLLGKVLNRMFGPDEKGILREQQIDGSKMPEFDAVRRYLGPSGMYVQSEENGWYMSGCLLNKQQPLR